MEPSFLQDFLTGLRELTGTPVIWKSIDYSENKPDEDLHFHNNTFCSGVKQKSFALCERDCSLRTVQKALKTKKPYIKKCHAGVVELVIPVFGEGRGYLGSFFFGPFRESNSRAAAKLPLFNKKASAAAEKVISSFSEFLINEKERLHLKKLSSGMKNERIISAISFINSNIGENLKAYDLAAHCGLSASRFVHLFKEETGAPVSVFLFRTKMEKAKELLSSTDLKASEIAFETGYLNQNYFASAFKRYTKITPTEYRKNKRRPAKP